MKPLILATAGHVDHGKSALVKALTGTHPDRLPEEKRRAMTIDLGFAELDLEDERGQRFHLGIIDVPGHEDFVKNMLAGVGSVDMAMLIVAADDGWMPQTEEHLQILTYLDLRHAVIALTKCDLVHDIGKVARDVQEKLRDSPFGNSALVPCSIHDSASLGALRKALTEMAAQTPQPRDIGKPRLPVDRAFTLHGIGTVVTGTLTGGALSEGDAVAVQPGGVATRIRTIQSHHREVASVSPGNRVALNLANISVANQRGELGVRRGDIITLPEAGNCHHEWEVELHRLERARQFSGMPMLRSGSMVRVHHGSMSSQARLHFFEKSELEAGQRALARLNFDRPVFGFLGDRFIVRDASGRWTLAGGVVLEMAEARNAKDRQQSLALRAAGPSSAKIFLETELSRIHVAKSGAVLPQSRWRADEIAASARDLCAAGNLFARGDYLIHAAWWRQLLARAAGVIDEHHRLHPDQAGLDVSALRSGLALDPEIADLLVRDLCGDGFYRRATGLARTSHRPNLPPALEKAGTKLRSYLRTKPFEPPSRKEMASDPSAVQALQFLLNTGEAVEVSREIVMDATAFAQAQREIEKRLRIGSATASELRETLKTSRRIIIPLLERLDRDGVTRRIGDRRVLQRS